MTATCFTQEGVRVETTSQADASCVGKSHTLRRSTPGSSKTLVNRALLRRWAQYAGRYTTDEGQGHMKFDDHGSSRCSQ